MNLAHCQGCGLELPDRHLAAGGYCVGCIEPEPRDVTAVPRSEIDRECVMCGALITTGELCRRCSDWAVTGFDRVFG